MDEGMLQSAGRSHHGVSRPHLSQPSMHVQCIYGSKWLDAISTLMGQDGSQSHQKIILSHDHEDATEIEWVARQI